MTPQEWLPLAVEFIKAVAWPVAIGVIAWRAGPALLKALSGRAVDVEGFGLRATIRTAVEQQQISGTENPVNRPALEPAPPDPVAVARPAVQIIEQQIRADLVQYLPANREPTLINALATMRLMGQHEFHYNRIFGSQIAGLRSLDEIGSATVEQARAFFEPHARQWPQIYATYGFDGWLGFLVSSGLVAREGDRLTATPFGHDFLIYLREARLTESKPG
jgi:hypothetical protein